MPGDPKEGNGGGELSERLRRLDEKLDAREAEDKRKHSAPSTDAADRSGFTRGLKLSGDFIGGVVAGFAVGWAFDKLTGWSPWGLIVFILLGFVAGILNVLRTLGAVPQFGGRK